MKILNLAIVSLIASSIGLASDETITSQDAAVSVARVVKVVTLVDKPEIMVNIAVVDQGGSTDVSPTQQLFFNLYSKGEMFSTDATFDLGGIFRLISTKRTAPGIYEVTAEFAGNTTDAGAPIVSKRTIDARKALLDLKKVRCYDEFDCEASENFTSTITVK